MRLLAWWFCLLVGEGRVWGRWRRMWLVILECREMAEDVVGHLGVFRRRYPELSRLLIDVREEYMAVRVKNLLDGSVGVVVVVVGLGHLRGLAKRLVGYGDGSVKGGFSVGASWTV